MARYTYKHIDNGDTHITLCFSTYEGKGIWGRAICASGDKFDPKIGEEIARAKLDRKVQRKRIHKHRMRIDAYTRDIKNWVEKLDVEQRRLMKDIMLLDECEDIIRKY